MFGLKGLKGSLLLRRFVFRMAEASAKRVTSDEPQRTMGRKQTASEARCLQLQLQLQLQLYFIRLLVTTDWPAK